MVSAKQFILPDLLAACPFPWATSLFYGKAGAESAAWVDSYHIFRDRKRAEIIQSSTELLASYVYPYAAYEEFRTCCDLINLLFVVDEISDDQDSGGVRETGDIFLRAMSGTLKDGSLLARITTDFRERFVRKAGVKCQERMVALCGKYVAALEQEARLRGDHRVLDTEAYMTDRRENSGVQVALGLVEYIHGIDLPDEVFEDPTFLKLHYAAVDLFILANDLYSYNMEQAKGLAGNNIMTVFMETMGLSIQQSADLIGEKFKELINDFVTNKTRLPSFGTEVDKGVQDYVFSLENTIVGNIMWSFDSKRYFGTGGHEIKRSLVVNIFESSTASLFDNTRFLINSDDLFSRMLEIPGQSDRMVPFI